MSTHNNNNTTTNPSAAEPSSTFTAAQRDRQARGKPYDDSSDEDAKWPSEGNRRRHSGRHGTETYADLERRRVAQQILDSPELLMMAAQRDDESVPATRLRWTRVLCGIAPPAPTFSTASRDSPQQQVRSASGRKGAGGGPGGGR
ncbi:hypothetical protein F4780DRAFT_413411 [Xylariomycetidae sp. FL0641]|nr:hypothetical protein F4780DRAFT_413411 [Xylariomycetidae sp. FL0641]